MFFYSGLAERFELYANGIEIVNAYTELNDPSKQKEMFKLQRLHGGGEDEKCFGDIDNIENQVLSTQRFKAVRFTGVIYKFCKSLKTIFC
jgi:elongation factor P--beta-lysine ligase